MARPDAFSIPSSIPSSAPSPIPSPSRREFLRAIAAATGALSLPALSFGHDRHANFTPEAGAPCLVTRRLAFETWVSESPPANDKPLRFGVFSLFAPQHLIVRSREALLLRFDGEARTLPANSDALHLRLIDGGRIAADLSGETFAATRIEALSTSGGEAVFTLEVPPPSLHGTIQRQFRGRLLLTAAQRHLQPVLLMRSEVAVASIVLAEAPPHAPPEFLRAQAAASRSFLLSARTGHIGFDFCDTTHCQFLRELPTPGSPHALAAEATTGLVLIAAGGILPAMYSRSCSGRTHALAESGLSVSGYPYYSVHCELCSRRPELWVRDSDAGSVAHSERARQAWNRVHGWSALPSASYAVNGAVLRGSGIGHGIGMCQRGAAEMAKQGATYREILAHYYPNTAIASAAIAPALA